LTGLSTNWKLQPTIYVITGDITPLGGIDFWQRAKELVGNVGIFGGYPNFNGIEKYITSIRQSHSILLIDSASASLNELELLAEQYPELLPIPCNQLVTYSSPLVYFDTDEQRNVIRGIIIGDTVDITMANMLYESGIPLGVALRYQNGQFITVSP
jgi:hypothetical protein